MKKYLDHLLLVAMIISANVAFGQTNSPSHQTAQTTKDKSEKCPSGSALLPLSTPVVNAPSIESDVRLIEIPSSGIAVDDNTISSRQPKILSENAKEKSKVTKTRMSADDKLNTVEK
jgi:hypothetical protein